MPGKGGRRRIASKEIPEPDAEVMEGRKTMRLSGVRQVQPNQSSVDDHEDEERIIDVAPRIENPEVGVLPVYSCYMGYITHIADGPYDFNFQTMKAREFLQTMTISFTTNEQVLYNGVLTPGSMVLTKEPEILIFKQSNIFKRSIVMNTTRCSALVYHIDYGDSEEVPFTNIYQLQQGPYSEKEPLAVKFALAQLQSMQVTDDMKVFFKDLLLGRQVCIVVVPRESNGPLVQYCDVHYSDRDVKHFLSVFDPWFQYTNQHFPRGNDIKITVCHVQTPSLFYVQFNSELSVIQKIHEAVQNLSQQRRPLSDLRGVCIGAPIAARFNDNVWYRGMVIGLENNLAEILYVDYGYVLKVPANWLCPIKRELVTQWRSQAVMCTLVGFEEDKAITSSNRIAMKAILNTEFNLQLFKILHGNRFLVELIDIYGNKLSQKIKQIQFSEATTDPGEDSDIEVVDQE